jgi:hypothetical protein
MTDQPEQTRTDSDRPCLRIDISQQRLWLLENERPQLEFPVSTAANGPGEQQGSEQTPRGWHQIRACIGKACPSGTVFVGRRPTGEVYTPELAQHYPNRDWILTRILWLSGLEPGFNRLGEVDTMRRYIYIHGCPDGTPLGRPDAPGSHGCVRMANADLITLFDRVGPGTRVHIG